MKTLLALLLALTIGTSQAHAFIDEGEYVGVYGQNAGFLEVDIPRLIRKGEIRLGDIYEHPIMDKYQHLKEITVKIDEFDLDTQVGEANFSTQTITLSRTYEGKRIPPKRMIRNFYHEMQHFIDNVNTPVQEYEYFIFADAPDEQNPRINELIRGMERKYHEFGLSYEKSIRNVQSKLPKNCKFGKTYCARLTTALELFEDYITK